MLHAYWFGIANHSSKGNLVKASLPGQIRVLNSNEVDCDYDEKMNQTAVEEDKKMDIEEKSQAVIDLQKENGAYCAKQVYA